MGRFSLGRLVDEMNERIKELWNKAAESTAAHPSGQNTSWETQVNFMDKFAELIVEECAGLFPLTFTDEQYQRRIDKTIRKHFGILE